MLKKAIVLVVLTFLTIGVNAQNCLLKDLSKKFNYRIILSRMKAGMSDNTKIQLLIYKKGQAKSSQIITFKAHLLYENAYSDCNKVRSDITGKNWAAEAPDYDYGELIIADLNFDGLEDIAIKNDSGGNGGPYYNFYLQDTKGHFTLSKYLTANMQSYPAEIDTNKKH